MVLFTLCATGMLGAVRYVSAELHEFEILFFRLVFGLLVILPWLIKHGVAPLRTGRLWLLALRAVFNVGAMLAIFSALSLAPLAQITALSFTAPIFAVILAAVLLRERVGARHWVFLALGFAGTLVVVRSGFEIVGMGVVLTMFGAVCWAMTLIIVKILGRTDSSVTITAYMSLMMAPLAFFPALPYWEWPTIEQFGWLIAIGILGGSSQIFLAAALKRAHARDVASLDFIKLIWATAIGFVVFHEMPDGFTWLGAAMIVASTILTTASDDTSAKADRSTPDNVV